MDGAFGGICMKEYVPIILIASFLIGFLGMALAKNAKKKSSYSILIISAAMAVITFVGIITAVIFMFFM